MAPILEGHHHRSTTTSHKPFKSRHATKGLIKDLSKGASSSIRYSESESNRRKARLKIACVKTVNPCTNK